MDPEIIKALIQQGEHSLAEFKIAPPRPAELAERLCGMANSVSGGWIVLGVADKSWKVVGVKSVPDAIDTVLHATRLCKPTVKLVANHPLSVQIDGKLLVVAQVPPNNGSLYQASGAYWLRRGTVTTPMETAEVIRFMYAQSLTSWELQPVEHAALEDIDLLRVQEYLTHSATRYERPSRLTDPVKVLFSLRCLTKIATETVPTNLGLIMFGRDPSLFFKQAEILLLYYQDELGVRQYTDRKIITGTIPEQIARAAQLLRLWTPERSHMEGFNRVDVPELPLGALREALVNAVVHRDYSLAGTAVRVLYYPDRVEIHSPGLLLPGLSLSELQQGLVNSRPRNPEIASILRDMPGGYMERMGSGIKYMVEQMIALGLPLPVFKEQVGEFVVIFYRNSDLHTRATTVTTKALPFSGLRNIKPAAPGNLSIEERQNLALNYIREHGELSYSQYIYLTGASETTATRDLQSLVKNQTLRVLGSGRNKRYLI